VVPSLADDYASLVARYQALLRQLRSLAGSMAVLKAWLTSWACNLVCLALLSLADLLCLSPSLAAPVHSLAVPVT
jgi:hypothetical protein